jgi:hypothetical protein
MPKRCKTNLARGRHKNYSRGGEGLMPSPSNWNDWMKPCEMCRKKHDTIESLKAKIEVLEEEIEYEKNRADENFKQLLGITVFNVEGVSRN